jgi:hypothetical protein
MIKSGRLRLTRYIACMEKTTYAHANLFVNFMQNVTWENVMQMGILLKEIQKNIDFHFQNKSFGD